VMIGLVTYDIVGRQMMARAVGTLYGIVAIPMTLGPPMAGPALLRARNVRVDQRDAVWCFCFASLATMCQPVSDWNDEAHILAKDHHFASCLFLSCRSAFRLHRQLQYRLFPVQRTRHLRKLRHVSHPESSSP